jgi:molybdenum cofactor cytidylyltransferase
MSAEWGFVVALLASGASRRLERPKQLLPFRGRPLVVHMAEEMGRAGAERVAVVLGAYAARIAPIVRGPGRMPRGIGDIEVLFNDDWEEGLASSVRVAARWADAQPCRGVVLALADQVGLTAGHVAALAAAGRRPGDRVASLYAGVLGAPAFFGRASFGALASLRGERGAAALLRAGAATHAIPFPAGVDDVDTPADVQRLLEPPTATRRRFLPAAPDVPIIADQPCRAGPRAGKPRPG